MCWNKHLKLCRKCPLHVKDMLALPWEIWSDRLSRQCRTYMYIFTNRWIDINSYCLKHRQTYSNPCHLHTICSKCPTTVQMQAYAGATSPTAWWITAWFRSVHSFWCVISVWHLRSRYVLVANNSSIFCKDDVTYYTFDDFSDNNCQTWLFNDSFKSVTSNFPR